MHLDIQIIPPEANGVCFGWYEFGGKKNTFSVLLCLDRDQQRQICRWMCGEQTRNVSNNKQMKKTKGNRILKGVQGEGVP